jgi:bromodomain and PHD finger-containing protein 1
MDQVRGNDQHPVIIQKTAYCDTHTPLNALTSPGKTTEDAREEQRERMKKARKMLAQKRVCPPVILIPTIPADKVQEIASLVSFKKKDQFLQRLIAYWTLKRQHRNGVPLIRRLQSQGSSRPVVASNSASGGKRSGNESSPDAKELYQQLKYWKCVRQDLERARLLCELVRKREKMKLMLIKTSEEMTMAQLHPLEGILHKVLDQLIAKDTHAIFLEPVDVDEVPDYMDIVKHPMDLGTMRLKLSSGEYFRLDDLEADFDLMIRNCLAYNERDTMFYRAGVRLRDQASIIFRTTRKDMERKGLLEPPQKTDEQIAQAIDDELEELTSKPPDEKTIDKMQELINKATTLKNGQSKAKRVKQIKAELVKARKNLKKESMSRRNSQPPAPPPPPEKEDSSESSSEDEVVKPPVKVAANNRQSLQTPPSSPLKQSANSASPSGVNRR